LLSYTGVRRTLNPPLFICFYLYWQAGRLYFKN